MTGTYECVLLPGPSDRAQHENKEKTPEKKYQSKKDDYESEEKDYKKLEYKGKKYNKYDK